MIGIIYCIVLAFFLKEKKTWQPEKQSFQTGLSGIRKAMIVLFGKGSFWVILFYFSVFNLPGWATKNWLPTLFSEGLHIDMTQAGPISTITLSMASLAGVLLGGFLSDYWVQKRIRGRVYTCVTGLFLIIPALLAIALGHSLWMTISGAICFGLGFGMCDANNMPILCQFVSSRYRATGFGLMNLAGISAGAIITDWLGKSADAGHLECDFALMTLVVLVVIILYLVALRPQVIDKKDDV
jgi:MFS family permease